MRAGGRRVAALAAPAALLAALSGCGDTGAAEDAVARLLPDPGSARFQSVRRVGDNVCGTVNGTNLAGMYDGYRRFVFDGEIGAALIEPRAGQTAAARGPDDPACRKPHSYQTVDERLACGAAGAPEERPVGPAEFEAAWSRLCT